MAVYFDPEKKKWLEREAKRVAELDMKKEAASDVTLALIRDHKGHNWTEAEWWEDLGFDEDVIPGWVARSKRKLTYTITEQI